MVIKKLTYAVWPVAAITPSDGAGNDTREDSERQRPAHTEIARQYSEGGGLLAELVAQPLDPRLALQIASTTVTISDAGREAERLDVQIVEGQPAAHPNLGLYAEISRLENK